MRATSAVGIPTTPEEFVRCGVNVNQPDLPHWCMRIIDWLKRIQIIQEAQGKIGSGYRFHLTRALEENIPYRAVDEKTGRTEMVRGPMAVYPIYADLVAAFEREAKR